MQVTGSVNEFALDTYTLTYAVADSSGNEVSVTRDVIVKDVEAPVIMLDGDNPLTLEVGTNYDEPGYTATDNVDGDITDKVEITSNNVDPHQLGEYEVRYSVTDSSGYTFEIVRGVKVVDMTPPEIKLNGDAKIELKVNEHYEELGATATDNYDKNLTIKTEGVVNTGIPGTYTVTYRVTDSSGNEASITRTVIVSAVNPSHDPETDNAQPPDRPENGGEPSQSNSRNTEQSGGGQLPHTATHTYVWLLTGLALTLAGFMGIRIRRRVKNCEV